MRGGLRMKEKKVGLLIRKYLEDGVACLLGIRGDEVSLCYAD